MTRYRKLRILVKIRHAYRGVMTIFVVCFMFLIYILFYPITYFKRNDTSHFWDNAVDKNGNPLKQ